MYQREKVKIASEKCGLDSLLLTDLAPIWGQVRLAVAGNPAKSRQLFLIIAISAQLYLVTHLGMSLITHTYESWHLHDRHALIYRTF